MDNYCPLVDYSKDSLFEDQIFSNPYINPCINGSVDSVSKVEFLRGQVQSPRVLHIALSKDPYGSDVRGSSRASLDLIRDHSPQASGDRIPLHGIVTGHAKSMLLVSQREVAKVSGDPRGYWFECWVSGIGFQRRKCEECRVE
jgi:hypothetical protein